MIWPFSRNSKPPRIPGLPLYDIHCHLLWGLDDGAWKIEDSFEMLDRYAALGYKGIIATPHTNHYMFDTPEKEQVLSRLETLRDRAASLDIVVKPGAEIMLRDDYPDAFEKKLFHGVNDVFLVEFENRPGAMTETFEKVLFNFKVKGRTLIMAHPERYPDVQKNPQIVSDFKAKGMLVQINLRALTGWHGSKATEIAWEFVENGVADIAGTDVHRARDFGGVSEALDELEAFDSTRFETLVSVNPRHVFEGKSELIEE